jgi:predicted nucleic acid-binding protein
MDAHALDALVTGYQNLSESLVLPDPKDRYVLAAAIVGQADAIVTFNLDDFPEDILRPYAIEAIHPDDFLVCQFDLSPRKSGTCSA